jgi:hypothetical protein
VSVANDCYDKILGLDDETKKRLFGDRPIPKDVLRRLNDDIQSIKDNFEKDPSLGTFQSRLNDYVKKVREFNQITKEVRKQDLIKAKNLMEFAKQPAFKGDIVAAVKARLTQFNGLANGGRDSAYSRGLAIHQRLLTRFLSELEKNPEDFRVLKSGQLDKEIGIETRALGENRGMGQTGNEQAQRIAKVLHDTNRMLMREHLNSGVPLGDMAGYVAPLTHDVPTLRNAGVDKWVDDVKKLPLDKQAVFGTKAGDSEAEDEILRGIYKGASLGKTGVKSPLTVDSFDESIYGQGTNLARKLTESRSLKFSNYDGEYQYNQMYGKDNLLNTFTGNLEKKSRMLGMIQVFGSNPENMINSTLDRMESQLRSSGDDAGASKIQRERQTVEFQLHEMTGRGSIPGDNTLAKIGSTNRAVQILSKLSNVGLRKLIDFPTMAMSLKSYEGGNFLQHLGSGLMEFGKTTASKETLKDMGEFFQDFSKDDGILPNLTKMQMKINGIGMLTDKVRQSFANLIQRDIGGHAAAGTDFKALPERLQATLLGAGIEDKDWQIIRQGTETAADGRVMLTHEGIGALDPELVKDRVKELKAETKGLRLTPEGYLGDLQNKYLGMVINGSNVSANVAGPAEHAIFNRGTYKGEVWGEILRMVGQFKSFWAKTTNSALMAMNSNPDSEMLAKGILQSGQKDFVTPSQWIVAATAFSYLGDSAIQLARGKNPMDPTNTKTWMTALGHAGAGGLITELSTPDADNGLSEQLLGPTLGQLAGPVAKLVGQSEKDLINGPGPRGGGRGQAEEKMALRLIRNNLPFQNYPGVYQLMNAVQDNIQESLTPGYKMKRSIKQALDDHQNRVNVWGSGGG